MTLMRNADPPPKWLNNGKPKSNLPLDPLATRPVVDKAVKKGYPKLTPSNIESFTKGMVAAEIRGPARLYRVVSPSNGAMGDCWISEEVWKKIMASSDSKAAWRKHLAVWPDWNGNGQFVVKEIPSGQSVKVWRGPASAQVKPLQTGLGDRYLEGGWEQIVLSPKTEEWDTTRYYKLRGGKESKPLQLHKPIGRDEYSRLSRSQQAEYTGIRVKVNDPNVTGPFDTGWGSTDFDAQLHDAKLGLPTLPGQTTNAKR